MQAELDFNQRFDGSNIIAKFDQSRLSGQLKSIYELMKDGRWRTLSEIANILNYSEASISAQLRNLRKERFGSFTVDKRVRGDRANGLFEYCLVV